MRVTINIIIPVYNTPLDKLQRCVDSINAQTYQCYEVILIDDGSDKSCAEYLDSISMCNRKLKVIHKKNEGSAVARNVGVLNAQYDYAMFVDSDDFIMPYVLEEAVELIETYSPDMIVGLTNKYVGNDDSILNTEIDKNVSHMIIESDKQKENYISHILGYTSDILDFSVGYLSDGPCAKICKVKLLREALFSEESFWNDDTIWNIKYTKFCQKIVITKNIWYAYIINPCSKTRKFREHCVEEFKYRTNQELELMLMTWPNCLNGIYIRIFRDTHILCSTYLFHDQNRDTFSEKLSKYKEAVHTDAYQTMLKNISFKCEKRTKQRIVKELVRFFSLHGLDVLSYVIWKINVNLSRGGVG